MSSTQPIPVLVGVGQVLQRLDDPREAAEPLAMMVAALEQAGEDAGAPKLLQRANSIYVLRGAWRYGDPGREIVRFRMGAIVCLAEVEGRWLLQWILTPELARPETSA